MSTSWQRLIGALSLFACLWAGCGGGGGGGFTVVSVLPNASADLGGGDLITITGTNFQTVQITTVTFGGVPGTNLVVLNETTLQVRTPPSPGGIIQTVAVALASMNGGAQVIPNAYSYLDTTPSPQTIVPTTFTPTGAEDFTITGTNLGAPGGQVTVIFQSIGSVTGNVSANAQSVTGRAPLVGPPPAGAVTVTIDTGADQADVPTTVSYSYALPATVGLPGQTLAGASLPARLDNGYAALCTSGANLLWNDADDDVFIITGPPNAMAAVRVSPRGAPGGSVGFLSPANSSPAVLGPNTFCVYRAGGPGVTGVVIVTLAQTAPVADIFPLGTLNAAPIAALASNRIAVFTAGADGVFGPSPANTADDLWVLDFQLAVPGPPPMTPTIVANAGIADVAAGTGNFSIPFTADGDTVLWMTVGPNGLPRDGDDSLWGYTVSTATMHAVTAAASVRGRPLALSASLLVVPGAGINGTFGNADDVLEVFTPAGVGWTRTPQPMGALNIAALVPYAAVGDGVAVAQINAVRVFTDPAAGTNTTYAVSGAPLLAPLGSGALTVFGPGANLVPRGGNDDQALFIDSDGAAPQPFSLVPDQFLTLAPLTDATRAFALAPGGDNVFGTNDDTLEVYQSRSLAANRSAVELPAGALPAARVSGTVPLVPIGPSWGLLQSPGANTTFGDGDDVLIVVTF
jgi:hypothetical protein